MRAEVDLVAQHDRLDEETAGPVFAAVGGRRLGRQHRRVGQVAGPEADGDRVVVAVLAVDEAVGPQGHVVDEAPHRQAPGERGQVAEEGVVRDGGEVLGDRVVPQIVGQLVGDAEQAPVGVFVEGADVQVPFAELMLQPGQADIADQVRARAGLAQACAGGIGGRRQDGALAAEVDDAARQARAVGLVVIGVQLQHGVLAEMDVEVALGQGAAHVALVDPAFAVAAQDVQPVADPTLSAADVELAGIDAVGVEAAHRAQHEGLRRPLQQIVEDAGRRLRAIEGARGPVDDLDAAQSLAGIGRGADQAQAIQAGVLHHAALETPRLGPRDLIALLVADGHRGQVAQHVVHRPRAHVEDQVLGDGGHRHRRVEHRLLAERSEVGIGDHIGRGDVLAAGHHHLADSRAGRRRRLGRRGLGQGQGRRKASERCAAEHRPAKLQKA